MLEKILNALIDHQEKSNTEIADEKGLNYQQVRVLGYLRADRHITAAKIAKDLDMSARQIERMLADLKAIGIIRREGANRNGHWTIVDYYSIHPQYFLQTCSVSEDPQKSSSIYMKRENNNSKKIIWYSLAVLISTISGISLLVNGLRDNDKLTVIIAGFILLLDLIMIVAFLVDYLRKS